MSDLAADTKERMRSALTIEMTGATRRAHQASISVALSTAGATTRGIVTRRRRVRMPALVAGLMIVLPLGSAIASESAVPGDLLYPIKRLVEPIRSVVDSDIAAEHRVKELAHLIDSPASSRRVADAVSDARDAVSELPPDHQLRTDLDRLTDRARDTGASVTLPSDEVDRKYRSTDPIADRQATDEPDDSTRETDTPTEPHPVDATTDTHEQTDRSGSLTEESSPTRDAPTRDG